MPCLPTPRRLFPSPSNRLTCALCSRGRSSPAWCNGKRASGPGGCRPPGSVEMGLPPTRCDSFFASSCLGSRPFRHSSCGSASLRGASMGPCQSHPAASAQEGKDHGFALFKDLLAVRGQGASSACLCRWNWAAEQRVRLRRQENRAAPGRGGRGRGHRCQYRGCLRKAGGPPTAAS
jgi:hypothetical protein